MFANIEFPFDLFSQIIFFSEPKEALNLMSLNKELNTLENSYFQKIFQEIGTPRSDALLTLKQHYFKILNSKTPNFQSWVDSIFQIWDHDITEDDLKFMGRTAAHLDVILVACVTKKELFPLREVFLCETSINKCLLLLKFHQLLLKKEGEEELFLNIFDFLKQVFEMKINNFFTSG
jgi:hypothetical protein